MEREQSLKFMHDLLRAMVAKKVVDNKVVRSRPLCPYPQVARYTGKGSIDDAANFRCEVPKGGR